MNRILKVLVVFAFAASFSSCSKNDNGELVGVQGRKPWFQVQPNGMVFIPSGVFQAGQSDQDVFFSLNAQTKTMSVKAFFMDDTEISNNEYRQFVFWVRDSLAHTIMGHTIQDDNGTESIDWKQKLDWSDPELLQQVSDLFFSESEQFYGPYEVDANKLIYKYNFIDLQEAANSRGKDISRRDIRKEKQVKIYPDTLVWIRDFAFSYNEPQAQNYFSHPAYDDYPVVGVTWDQANAFCHWRTKYWNSYRLENGESNMPEFRLPTEWEFEYAARGGLASNPYPWGGPYIRNDKGCFLANFKPGRGSYADDGGFYTVKVGAYNPNDYGLFNMSGNVAEWTITAFEESATSTVHDLQPDFKYNAKEDDDKVMKRKVIRGGSWKDVGYMLQNGTRTYEYQDSAKSYIGFRCAIDFLGRSMDDF
jgi:gliding motility-associated lipoprotein GldK